MSDFAKKLVLWQCQFGRKDLPWQVFHTPYERWLSEVMLQQTQVVTVIPYFQRFLEAYPDVVALANANDDDVMALWAGLGYYSRARNLLKAARYVVNELQGVFPTNTAALQMLPGVGPSTAGAIAAFTSGERAVMVDGNVKRFFARHFAIPGAVGEKEFEKALWQKAQSLLPSSQDMAAYTQGLMDMGATICTRTQPACLHCPVNTSCLAHQEGSETKYPGARHRKERPVRHAVVIVPIDDQQGVWLAKKEEKGVWKGLWCPIVIENESDILTVCETGGLSKFHRVILPDVIHDFTHYRLIMHPAVVIVHETPDGFTHARRVDASSLSAVGMPAPIKTLVHTAMSLRSFLIG